MDLNRFLIYIQGGTLVNNGISKTYPACQTDTALPRAEEAYIIKRRFYFAKKSGTWNTNGIGHGVGFISTKANNRSLTYAKLYLISKDQFKHLFEQENSGNPRTINYNNLQVNKYLDCPGSFYNRIIQLEDNYKNYPILTFTNQNILPKNKPMNGYIQLISDGIKATHNLNDKDILSYMRKAKR